VVRDQDQYRLDFETETETAFFGPETKTAWSRNHITAEKYKGSTIHIYILQGGSKKLAPFFLYALTLPNINRFSKLFYSQNQEKICNNTVTKDPSTPQLCRYTTLLNVTVLKATNENKTTSVTTYFKKLTTGNNVFIVSVIL